MKGKYTYYSYHFPHLLFSIKIKFTAVTLLLELKANGFKYYDVTSTVALKPVSMRKGMEKIFFKWKEWRFHLHWFYKNFSLLFVRLCLDTYIFAIIKTYYISCLPKAIFTFENHIPKGLHYRERYHWNENKYNLSELI